MKAVLPVRQMWLMALCFAAMALLGWALGSWGRETVAAAIYFPTVTALAAMFVARDMTAQTDATGVAIEGRLTRSPDGIFLHVTKRDGGGAGLRLDGTLLENWAKEQLDQPRPCSTT